jgi:hypothetical protein
MNNFRRLVGLLGRAIGLYLYRTAHIDADKHPFLDWVRTHDPSVRATKFYALDRVVTAISKNLGDVVKILMKLTSDTFRVKNLSSGSQQKSKK